MVYTLTPLHQTRQLGIFPQEQVLVLETLEELSIEGKKTFLDSGGEEFTYIDCLNDSDFGVKVIASLLE